MKNLESIKIAVRALTLNKVRSFLTMLGVIIGVFSVVALVSIVKGFENYITDQFSALGSNLIIVSPGDLDAQGGGDLSKIYTNNKLEIQHFDLIKRNSSNKVKYATPSYRQNKVVVYKTKSYLATASGGNEQIQKVLDLVVDSGRFFNKSEVDSKAKVVILGQSVLKELFGTKNPLDEKVKIGDDSFVVIGVVKEKGTNYDDTIYMPYTSMRDVFGLNQLTNITLKTENKEDIDTVVKETELLLLRELKSDEFTVLSQQDILSSIQDILGIVSVGLSAIAGISLLVGGIGIMNIMLVSVTERIREIGLRKALGATSFNIGLQFLTESVILSFLGGFIGLALGWLLTFSIQSIIRAEVPWWSILLAFGFSLVVGVVFGTYPAIKASKKDPIEALRYE